MADVGVVHGPPGENWKYFGWFWAAIVIVSAWTFVFAFALFKVMDWTCGMRVAPEEEEIGLDEGQHGESMLKGAGLETIIAATPLFKVSFFPLHCSKHSPSSTSWVIALAICHWPSRTYG